MRWLHNHSRTATGSASAAASSSSSSVPASSLCSFSLTVAMDFSINGLSSTGGPKLTRQTNLRYLSEKKILGALQQLPHVAEAGGDSSTGAGAVVSMPLPLPLPPSSPEQATTSSTREDRAKASQHADGTSSRASSKNLKGDKNSSRQNSRSSTAARSAPTSPLSIDAIRNSSNDFLQYYYITPKTNNVWSAPEIPTGNSFPIAHEQHAYSFESPPIRSPQVKSPVGTSKSSGGSASSLYPRSSPTGRQDSNPNAGVHPLPLPLPPSAALRSPSSIRNQASVMTESVALKGQWKKGKLIGRGTFGSVYVASNRETGALCAMKEVELCPEDPKSQECIKQLEQEINVLSRLKHPNIVQYYGSETVDDRFYIYLEYVHPGSINKYVRDNFGAITESVVRNFTRHILSGLAYLHRKKTVHRDIKGANLLVDASGVVKLADFGMAKHLTGQAADLSLKGSPYWMAPELICSVMKNENSDHAFAVDIWSLGCTIIEMITGKPPWSEFEGAAAMFRVLSDTPPIPDMLSSEGKDFLQCCFRRNPADRPSATKLLDHRFLKSLSPLDLSFRGQPSFPRKSETPRSMRERAKAAVDKPILPLRSHNTKPKGDHDSDPGWTPVFENMDLASVTRFSPRSILDTLPSLSLRAEQASIHPRVLLPMTNQSSGGLPLSDDCSLSGG